MATSNIKIEGLKAIYLDIMIKDRFVCQLKYYHCPIFKLSLDELKKFVLEQKLSLVNKDFVIYFSNNRI